ncbi:hypothetical protein L7F22_005876 [Adiantum nelumboides]|nr:hypothetical protein [Adiantum nelumboides]
MFNPDEEINYKKALVPVTTYREREGETLPTEEQSSDWRSPPVLFLEHQYNMDYNTLMFIAGQGRQQQPNAYAKEAPNAPLGPCYNCAGDHLIKDCPYPRQVKPAETTSIPMLARFCIECGIKHLVVDCPSNPEKNKQTHTHIHSVTVHPSGSSDENIETVSVEAITRAQARANAEVQTEADALTSESGRIARRNYWRTRRMKQAEK